MAKKTEIGYSVLARQRDLVIRIADWTRDSNEPGFDVEVYVTGDYSYQESETFTTRSSWHTRKQAREQTVDFVCKQVRKLLK